MKKLSEDMYRALEEIPGMDVGAIRRAARVNQVRQMWAQLVEKPILDHTNGVYVFDEKGRRQMHVYMDESIYAAELNNRRELLKLQCRERFGEAIDDFHIHISRGKYKRIHPFRDAKNGDDEPQSSVALSAEERERVEQSVAGIADERLKNHFKQAMIRDLEWKKGQTPHRDEKN